MYMQFQAENCVVNIRIYYNPGLVVHDKNVYITSVEVSYSTAGVV